MTDLGLSIARSAIDADQVALDAISQNIANANTAGYVRTTVDMSAVQVAGVGGGVEVSGLQQVTDPTLDAALQTATGGASYATASAAALSALQDAVPEPSSTGLASQLTSLWSDFDSLGNDTSSTTAASALVTQASQVAATLNSAAQQVQQVANGQRSAITATVTQDNALLQQVASLNAKIVVADASPAGAGGLSEQRNQLVSQLASDLGVSVRDQPNGSESLYLGGVQLVSGSTAATLGTQSTSAGGLAVTVTSGNQTVVAGSVGNGSGGALGAAVDALDVVIPTMTGQLDQVAQAVASSVNAVTTGAGVSQPVFVQSGGGTVTAAGVAVTAAVITDPSLVATDSGGDPVSGAAYQEVAEAASAAAASGSSTFTVGGVTLASPDAAWQQVVSQIGQAASNATTASSVTAAAVNTATSRWQSASGVDQNEELTTMLQVQNAYQASAKVLTTINTTINALLDAI